MNNNEINYSIKIMRESILIKNKFIIIQENKKIKKNKRIKNKKERNEVLKIMLY